MIAAAAVIAAEAVAVGFTAASDTTLTATIIAGVFTLANTAMLFVLQLYLRRRQHEGPKPAAAEPRADHPDA